MKKICISKKSLPIVFLVLIALMLVFVSQMVQSRMFSTSSRAQNILEVKKCRVNTYNFEKNDSSSTCEDIALSMKTIDPAITWEECKSGVITKCQVLGRKEGYPPYNGGELSSPLLYSAESTCLSLVPCEAVKQILPSTPPIAQFTYFADGSYTNDSIRRTASCQVPCKTLNPASRFACYTYENEKYIGNCYGDLKWEEIITSSFSGKAYGEELEFSAPHICSDLEQLLGIPVLMYKSIVTYPVIEEAEKGCGSKLFCRDSNTSNENGFTTWKCIGIPPLSTIVSPLLITPTPFEKK